MKDSNINLLRRTRPSFHSAARRAGGWLALLSALIRMLAAMGCSRSGNGKIQGYIEGDFVYVSSPLAGTLEELKAIKGQEVQKGDFLFALENAVEKAARDEAAGRVEQAQAAVEDLKKGRRPSELDALQAQIGQAEATLKLAETEAARQEKLSKIDGATTQQESERARSLVVQEQQRLAVLRAELATAKLGARADQIAGAEANARAQEAALARADWALEQKKIKAPAAGLVYDTLYRPGEWVGAGKPVVSLLPPGNVKLRTFVPEGLLSSLRTGQTLRVFLDGAAESFPARINYISPRAEFTPPVIYSRENREKFVYLVEAVFNPAISAKLRPGQPVDVQLEQAAKR
jgi:HlyD family secretion protein